MKVPLSAMRKEELALFRAVGAGQWPRDAYELLGMKYWRMLYYCNKWAYHKGKEAWYEYGVSIDLGWLTSEGKTVLAAIEGGGS